MCLVSILSHTTFSRFVMRFSAYTRLTVNGCVSDCFSQFTRVQACGLGC